MRTNEDKKHSKMKIRIIKYKGTGDERKEKIVKARNREETSKNKRARNTRLKGKRSERRKGKY